MSALDLFIEMAGGPVPMSLQHSFGTVVALIYMAAITVATAAVAVAIVVRTRRIVSDHSVAQIEAEAVHAAMLIGAVGFAARQAMIAEAVRSRRDQLWAD